MGGTYFGFQKTLLIVLSLGLMTACKVNTVVNSSESDSTPSIQLKVSSEEIQMQENGNALIVLVLSKELKTDAAVNWEIVGPNASSRFSPKKGLLNFSNSDTNKSINFSALDDNNYDSDQNYSLVISTDDVRIQVPESVDLLLKDNDPVPTLSVNGPLSFLENVAGGVAQVGVSLSHLSTIPLSFNYSVSGGSALGGGVDYTLDNGFVTFAPGELNKTVDIIVIDESLQELDETIQVELSSSEMDLPVPANFTLTIVDEDTPPEVNFSQPNSSVAENIGTGLTTMNVQLSKVSSLTVTVDYAVSGGNATGSGTDFTLANGTLTFIPGDTSKSFDVAIVDDALDEVDETVIVTLSNFGNSTAGTNTSHTLTISDEDPTPNISFADVTTQFGDTVAVTATLDAVSGRDVVIDWNTQDGTATAPTDYVAVSSGSTTLTAGQSSVGLTFDSNFISLSQGTKTATVIINGVTNAVASSSSATVTLEIPTPGTVDTSFAGGDYLDTTEGSYAGARSVVMQDDGKIIAYGKARVVTGSDHTAIYRFEKDGTLDPAFGTSGVFYHAGSGSYEKSKVILQQSDEKLLGLAETGYSSGDIFLIRVSKDGVLDTSFNSPNGWLIVDLGGNGNGGHVGSMALQADGKIIVVGIKAGDFYIARLNTDGSFDSSFGTAGATTIDVNGYPDYPKDVLVLEDGKILVAGYSEDAVAQSTATLVRLNGDGSIDTSYGTNGIVTLSSFLDFRNLALQLDGKVLIQSKEDDGGGCAGGSVNRIVRLNSDGTLDSSFGSSGVANTPVCAGGCHSASYGVILDRNGKIYSGMSTSSSNFNLTRLLADGTVDTSFDGDGCKAVSMNNTNYGGGFAMHQDGRIVLATGRGPVNVKRVWNDIDGLPTISASNNSDLESVVASVSVKLSHAVSWLVHFDWATADDSALSSGDYTAASASDVIIPSGLNHVRLSTTVNDDGDIESTEDFFFNLSNIIANQCLMGTAQATYSIIDND